MTQGRQSLGVAIVAVVVWGMAAVVPSRSGLWAAPPSFEAPQGPDAASGEFLEGRIVVQGGNPIPVVELYLRTPLPAGFRGDAAVQTIEIRSGADGRFRSRVPNGTHFIEASRIRLPDGYEVATLSFGNQNLTQGSIELRSAARLPMTLVLRSSKQLPAVGVSGRVRVEPPVSDRVTLRLACQSYALPLEAPVRADGSFEFRGVRPCGYSGEVLQGAAAGLRTSFHVKVADRDVGGIDLRLPATRAVRITTTHDWPGTVPTYHLSLQRVEPDSHHLSWGLTVKPGMTMAQMPVGEFTISGVSAGTLFSSMTYDGVDVLSQWRLTIRPDGAGELRVGLRLR